MARMLTLSDQEFKAPMINMLRAQMDKVYSIKEQMGKVNTEMEILRKNQREMLAIQQTVTEMKNVFDGLVRRLGTAEERISDLQDTAMEIFIGASQTEKQREQGPKKQNRISMDRGIPKKV